ncbi:hypothetical protein J1605_014657, partial [Eschrichtius robustus]
SKVSWFTVTVQPLSASAPRFQSEFRPLRGHCRESVGPSARDPTLCFQAVAEKRQPSSAPVINCLQAALHFSAPGPHRFPRRLPSLQSSKPSSQPAGPGQFRSGRSALVFFFFFKPRLVISGGPEHAPGSPLVERGRREGRRMVGWRVAVLCLWVSCGSAAGQLEYSVSEETERGVAVGNVAQDLRLSAAALSLRNFRFLSSHGEPYFEVDLASGSLVVREPADRERLCGDKAACVLTYELVLEDPLELHKMHVHVLDTNDNSPHFPAGDVQLHIPEFLMPGARFTLPNAQDADEGSNGVLSYSLSPSQHFRLDMGSRVDGSESPELVWEKALDREQRATHRLVLTARDGGLPARSEDAQVTVVVVDTNDNAPVFERSVYRTKVPETAPNGTVLFRVQASDPDEGSNGEIRYSLSNSTQAKLRHHFHVHPRNGEVRVAASLGPPEALLEAYIEARDEGAFGLASTAKLLVEVTDVNDHAPEVNLLTFSSPVSEDTAAGTVIALLSVRDEDLGPNDKVICSMSTGGPFKLKASFDNYYSLLTDGPLDREQVSEY